jgi:transcriptional regulator with XRE-family HTH domain
MADKIFSIGPLMKAARKFKKINQAEVAQAIGCSQSALSKMEHNLLIPSAPQWFLFARFMSIPPETIESGIIDRQLKVKFNSNEVSLGFKIPKRYRRARSEKVRELYPFLKYLEFKLIPPKRDDFIQFTGLDPEFFLDFDNLINFQLILDCLDYFIKQGLSSPSDIKGIVNFGQDELYWENFGIDWKKLTTVSAVLNAFARDQVFFQADFQLKVEGESGKINVSYFPEYHLKEISGDIPNELVEFLNLYRKATLENLVERTLGVKVKVGLILGASTSRWGARFEVQAA